MVAGRPRRLRTALEAIKACRCLWTGLKSVKSGLIDSTCEGPEVSASFKRLASWSFVMIGRLEYFLVDIAHYAKGRAFLPNGSGAAATTFITVAGAWARAGFLPSSCTGAQVLDWAGARDSNFFNPAVAVRPRSRAAAIVRTGSPAG